MKPKNNASDGKTYYCDTLDEPIGKRLIYAGLLVLLFIIYLVSRFGKENVPYIIGLGEGIIAIVLGVILLILKLGEGYALEEDCIYYKYRYIERKTLYKDIKCILIVFSTSKGRITLTPYVVMMGGNPEKVLRFCMDENRYKRHVLCMDDIRNELKEEIGYYDYKNCWKIFSKGSFAPRDYGFEWNEKEMGKVLKGFSGDYYVAASVIDRYQKKYDEMVKEYGLDERRIHIVDDSIFGVFRWQ